MGKRYQVHVCSHAQFKVPFYFVETDTGKKYDFYKFPPGFEDLDDEAKNDAVEIVVDCGYAPEYGSYHFKKIWIGETWLDLVLTEYGKQKEAAKKRERMILTCGGVLGM